MHETDEVHVFLRVKVGDLDINRRLVLEVATLPLGQLWCGKCGNFLSLIAACIFFMHCTGISCAKYEPTCPFEACGRGALRGLEEK